MLRVWAHQDRGFRPELRLSPLFYPDDQISIFPAPLGKRFKFVLSDLNVIRLDFDSIFARRPYFLSQEMRLGLLRLQYVVLVDPPTSKEAVAHHLLPKQKNEADQDGH
jgi:hypothetical protein